MTNSAQSKDLRIGSKSSFFVSKTKKNWKIDDRSSFPPKRKKKQTKNKNKQKNKKQKTKNNENKK